MSVYHKADPGELIQWVTPESQSSAASNSGLIRIGTQPRTADAWHHDSCRPRGVVTRDFRPFLTVCLTVFPFEFRPRTFTIGFFGKKSFISELMILECSFPLTFVPHLSVFVCPCFVATELVHLTFVPFPSVFVLATRRTWRWFYSALPWGCSSTTLLILLFFLLLLKIIIVIIIIIIIIIKIVALDLRV